MSIVLVVDDNPLFAMSLSEALEEQGCTVRCESSGRNVLAAVPMLAIDAAIIDVGLPDVSGIELARALRERRSTLPIVLCTGYDGRVLASVAEELKVSVIEKPIEDADLAKIMLDLIAYASRSGEVAPA